MVILGQEKRGELTEGKEEGISAEGAEKRGVGVGVGEAAFLSFQLLVQSS